MVNMNFNVPFTPLLRSLSAEAQLPKGHMVWARMDCTDRDGHVMVSAIISAPDTQACIKEQTKQWYAFRKQYPLSYIFTNWQASPKL